MIILDTCILRSCGLESSSAEVLRAIRTAGVEGVSVPWMVMEELCAQYAVKYRKQHEAAAQALQSLGNVTPWGLSVRLPDVDLERVRDHWRKQWASVVDLVPTSGEALRQGAFREANALPPCRDDGRKTGARDAAIWLSAIEYARAHEDEKVYFVSENTRDFGDGTSYTGAMADDVDGLGDRFVHLTGVGEVIDRFTEPADTDMDVIRQVLSSPEALRSIKEAAGRLGGASEMDMDILEALKLPGFRCSTGSSLTPVEQSLALRWAVPEVSAQIGEITAAESYRVGEQVWCVATVRWLIGGLALLEAGISKAACAWETRLLFALHSEDPRLNVLRSSPLQPVSEAEFGEISGNFLWGYVDPGSPLSADLNRRRAEGLVETMADPNGKTWMRLLAAATLATNWKDLAPLAADIRMGETHTG
ncbi:PIN domain-containing protein [Streptomyces sp. NPDC057620]|uniref:PIN domain-containing protein n=1 Tax=Streptomyces sp. NPDC057620 TaxID=3346185 RepID=UPI00367AEABF